MLCSIDIALAQAPIADTPVTTATVKDATPPTYESGLVAEIYKLPVRPRRLRNPIPGLPVSVVKTVATPLIGSAADLDGITGSVQVDYKGEMFFPKTGDYTFSAEADDAMDLQIDGKMVLANAWINGNNAPSVVTSPFTAGWHPVHVRFYQGDGGYKLNLRWKPAGANALQDLTSQQFRVSADQVMAANKKKTMDEGAEKNDPSLSHRAIFRSTGFFELPEADGDLLIEVLEGPTLYTTSARKDLVQLLQESHYQELPARHQVMVLAGFLRGWHSEQSTRGAMGGRAPYLLSQPQATTYDGWNASKRQGFKHVVTIENAQFTIYTPAADSPERENVAQAIAGLPKSLRTLLKQVRVEPYGTADEFNGGGDEIWVRRGEPTPLSMLDNVLSHEIGHLLMNKTDCYPQWQEAIGRDVLSVSHYGRMNPSEDFAEFVRLFLSTKGDAAQIESLRQLFPARMKTLEGVLQQTHFSWN
jgi:hypothetical protein